MIFQAICTLVGITSSELKDLFWVAKLCQCGFLDITKWWEDRCIFKLHQDYTSFNSCPFTFLTFPVFTTLSSNPLPVCVIVSSSLLTCSHYHFSVTLHLQFHMKWNVVLWWCTFLNILTRSELSFSEQRWVTILMTGCSTIVSSGRWEVRTMSCPESGT